MSDQTQPVEGNEESSAAPPQEEQPQPIDPFLRNDLIPDDALTDVEKRVAAAQQANSRQTSVLPANEDMAAQMGPSQELPVGHLPIPEQEPLVGEGVFPKPEGDAEAEADVQAAAEADVQAQEVIKAQNAEATNTPPVEPVSPVEQPNETDVQNAEAQAEVENAADAQATADSQESPPQADTPPSAASFLVPPPVEANDAESTPDSPYPPA